MKNNTKGWLAVLFLLGGVVIGGLVGKLTHDVSFLSWLSYGQSFGIGGDSPAFLDLGVFKLWFGFTIEISVATVLFLILAMFLYRKTVK